MSPTPFRWAILGTGGVSRKFVHGLAAVPGHRAIACASRSLENAERFQRAFDLEASGDFATIAAHPQADALYIATPPSAHAAHALAGIEAGKPVLIEKPFALDRAAAARILEAARANGVPVIEAMWTRFQPLITTIKAAADRGDYGELRGFEAQFYGADVVDPTVSLFDPAQGGGALMHRGVYGLSLARDLLGPVAEWQVTGRLGETGVDEDVAVTLRHDSGAISTLRAGLRSAGVNNSATLRGTQASVQITAPLYRPPSARVVSVAPRQGGTSAAGTPRLEALRESGLAQRLNQALGALRRPGRALAAPFAGNGYGHEAAAMADIVRAGTPEHPRMTHAETLDIMGLLDEIRGHMGMRI